MIIADGNVAWPSNEGRNRPFFAAFQYGTRGVELGARWNLLDWENGSRKLGDNWVGLCNDFDWLLEGDYS